MGVSITLEEALKSESKLEDYLQNKAQNHNYFKLYTTLAKIENLIKEQSLFLSTGERWNDILDRKHFNNPIADRINFGCCLSFSKSENMAMWMLYGGIHKQGAMLKISPSDLTKSIKGNKIVEAGFFENNKFVPVYRLTRDQYTVKLIDMVYYGKSPSGYTIKRSDERCDIKDIDVLQSLCHCMKRYPWSYENECRLIISVKRGLWDDSRINQIRFPVDAGSMTEEQIVVAPNFEGTTDYAKSSLGGEVDWDLCENCKDKCDQREKCTMR